jgi:response regulator RpfG family c-di-GMP phosphodiesterase
MDERLLFVDDEPNILAGYKRQLRTQFNVETATSGQQGLELLTIQGPFAVVVADFRMPGMDGVQFLTRAREVSPDTVRMMLTGHAELAKAIEAVNEGNIFRFLTKPCPPESLIKALTAGLDLYRLVISERELLEKTLSNSIRLLTEVLSLVKPAAFSQTLRLRKIVRQMTIHLKLYDAWQYELAAMLSQIGSIALPPYVLEKAYAGEPLSKIEESMFASHPMIGYKLLLPIPRIGAVPAMVRDQRKIFGDYGPPPPGEDRKAALGAQMLKTAIDYDRLIDQGMSHHEIIKKLIEQTHWHNPEVVRALGDNEILKEEWIVKVVDVSAVEVGMLAGEDILSKDGQVIAPKNQEVSGLVLERLLLTAQSIGLVEPFCVMLPKRTTEARNDKE